MQSSDCTILILRVKINISNIFYIKYKTNFSCLTEKVVLLYNYSGLFN